MESAWTRILRFAMENAPFYVGTIMILVGSGVGIPYVQIHFVPGMEYVLVFIGIILIAIGVFIIIRKDLTTWSVRYIGIKIDSPYELEKVDFQDQLRVIGRYKKWPSDLKLWLFSLRDGKHFPLGMLTRMDTDEKTWSAQYWVITRGEGMHRDMAVYAVGEDGSALIAAYIRCCLANKDRHGEAAIWPGILQLGPDFALCAQRTIVLAR